VLALTTRDGRELVGVKEIAARCGASRARVRQWHHRGHLGEPHARLACGPVWVWEEVELPPKFAMTTLYARRGEGWI